MVSLRAHFIPVSFSSGGVKDIYTISERTDGGVVDEKQLVVAHPKKNLRLFGPGNYIIENVYLLISFQEKGDEVSNLISFKKRKKEEEKRLVLINGDTRSLIYLRDPHLLASTAHTV